MKHLLRPLALAALILGGSSPATAQTPRKSSSTAAAESAGNFSIKWKPSTPLELTGMAGQLEFMKREASLGKAESEQVRGLESRLQDAERRAPPIITVISKGGTLGEFVSTASSLEEISLTLINAAEPADLATPVPAFELRNTNWGTIIEVLRTFLEGHGLELRVVGGSTPNPTEARSVVCVLSRTGASRAENRERGVTEFESLPLGEHLHGTQTVEVIVDAIRAAWELDPAHPPEALRLKFHPGTKLLLVSGPASAGAIARHVVAGLEKKPAQR